MTRGRRAAGWLLSALLLAGGVLLAGTLACAAAPPVREAALSVFPEADDTVTVSEAVGAQSVARVSRDGTTLGYAFSTWDVVGSLGFSGKPVDILVGLSVDGRITGARLVSHQEPILIIGIPHERLARFVAGFAGYDIRETPTVESGALPEVVSGASVSSAVIQNAIIRAARAVADAQGLFAADADTRRLDRASFAPATWGELVAEKAIVHRVITHDEVNAAIPDSQSGPGGADPAGTFIELFAALATPAGIGQNLLGQRAYNRLAAEIGPQDNVILIAANGLYSFKGTKYRKTGRFERIQLVQDGRTIALGRTQYRNVQDLEAEGAPDLRETGLFTLPEDSGFDPLKPWRIDLMVTRETASGVVLSASFALPYRLPERFIAGTEEQTPAAGRTGDQPLWQSIWVERRFEVAALCIVLFALTGILVFQDAVVRNDRLYRAVRLGFLGVTLIWIGWIAGAQLSVVNVITFSQSLLTGFSWDLFLLDPLVFLLWGFTAMALLFWGRGVFCGWLCPFGALQELLNEAARKIGLAQIKVPFALHERLWPIKYIIFLGLFAVSLGSVELAFRGAEVEPFKTVISLKFMREWPFVTFAAVLLVAGLFIERFYCRYLCPLGAALAIPARLHMFEWLKRRPQCGTECRVCEVHCTVQAIHPDGTINPNECIHCLNCQRLYYDKTMCPPLILKEKRRLKRAAVAERARAEGGAE